MKVRIKNIFIKLFASNNSRGFTLLEVLISIVLLAFIMIGVFGLVDNSSITKEKVTLEDRNLLQLESALNRFGIDLSQIYTPMYHSSKSSAKASDDQERSEQIERESDQMELMGLSSKYISLTSEGIPIPKIENPRPSTFVFLTAANKRKVQNSKQSNYAWVQYALRKTVVDVDEDVEINKDAPFELIRYLYAFDPYSEEHKWDSIKPYVLLKNIKSLEFSFWNQKSGEYTDLDEIPEKERHKILAVKLNMIWLDISNFEWKIEKTFRPLWPDFDMAQEIKELTQEEEEDSQDEEET